MNELQLDYFVSVARTGNFSRSAENLFVSTPAVSKQITALENELGFRLFTRTPKGSELTPSGAILLDHVLTTRMRLSKVLQDAKNTQAAHLKTFRLGIVESWAWGERLNRIRAFLESLDFQWELCVLSGNGKEMFNWLDAGEADAVICINDGRTVNFIRQNQYRCQHLTYIRRGFLFSARNPLAVRPDLVPSDFEGQLLYSLSNNRKMLAQEGNEVLCRGYGFSPEIRPMDSLFSIIHTISAGKGFTVIDEWNMLRLNPDFAWLPVRETHDVVLSWVRENDPTLAALAQFCAEELFPDRVTCPE